jgi:DNA-binding transcriptional regulator YiaG
MEAKEPKPGSAGYPDCGR